MQSRASTTGRQLLSLAPGLILAALLLGAGSCRSSETQPTVDQGVRVGILPDQMESDLRRMHDPLVRYLGAATQRQVELVIPSSYDELVRRFADGEFQLVWFGGLTFLRAEALADAEPLAMRDIDLEFTTDFLAANSAPGRSLEDFAGTKLAFGPRLSTSGHLMPRYFLETHGIDPESFFSDLRHSSGHDQTAAWVRAGLIDLGAVNSSVLEAMLADGRLAQEDVRVVWTTPPYRNYVWAMHADAPDRLRQELLDAFLALDLGNSEHAAILQAQGAGGYVPASRADYDDLRGAAAAVGLAMSDEVGE